jgi:hypothetical protein
LETPRNSRNSANGGALLRLHGRSIMRKARRKFNEEKEEDGVKPTFFEKK